MKTATEHQKRRARAAANYAFPAAQPCETCGTEPGQRHHDDYDRPLEIRWLCDPCHRAEHRKPQWRLERQVRRDKRCMAAGAVNAEPAFSLAQAATRFEMSERALRTWMAEDDFPLRRLRRGRRWALSARQVEQYLNGEIDVAT